LRIHLQYLVFKPPLGGVETYFVELGRRLVAKGHKVEVFCAQASGDEPMCESIEGMVVFRYPRPKLGPLGMLRRPNEEVKALSAAWKDRLEASADLVISRHPYFASATLKCVSARRVLYLPPDIRPQLVLKQSKGQGAVDQFFAGLHALQLKAIERSVLRRCYRIVTLSENMKSRLVSYYRISPEKIEVNPPGVDVEKYCPGEKDSLLLQELKIPEDAKIVLSVGRLSPEKNYLRLVRAVAQMKRDDVYLVILGEGGEREKLEAHARHLGLFDKFRLPGLKNDVFRWYRIADVLALLSLDESFGHVYLEAMASGIPCVASAPGPGRNVASAEIIEYGKSGLLVDPLSESMIAACLDHILENGDLRAAFSKAGRKRCEEMYSWDRHIQALLCKSFADA